MKKLLGLITGLFLVVLIVGSVSALTFTDTITWNDVTITDTGNSIPPGSPGYVFAYTYTHTVDFDPAAATVDSAFLDITTKSNAASGGEVWFIYGQGDLSDSTNNAFSIGWFGFRNYYDEWVTDTFDLSELIAGVNGSSWAIAFSLDENTLGEDETIKLRASTLRGEYSPVPEPATMMLFGLGLLGLAGVSRKKK